jgi:hypothetical protein
VGQTEGESSKQNVPDVNMIFSEAPIHHDNPETSRAAESRRYNWNTGVIPCRQQRYETVYPDIDLLKVSQNGFGFLALTPQVTN